MSRLMVSVSGVRGVYGDGLNDECAEKFVYAFGKLHGSPVVVGRDSRKSGEALSRAVISGLRKAGTDVIYTGLASTPTVEMAVTAKHAAGGVIITASHNTEEWNGLKFLNPDGIFLNADQGSELLDRYNSLENLAHENLTGSFDTWDGANEHHIQSVLNLDFIDRNTIASNKFTVCIDMVNGAGGPICCNLLRQLGCMIYAIHEEPTGNFAHNPEPMPEHILELCALVKERQADTGFAVDPDVDRLSIVDEKGHALGEEYTLALAADYLMEKTGTAAACNLSTSRMIDDAAKRYDVLVHRSPVGEINVVELMREVGAGVGGEGNGGIIVPACHPGRDAVLGIALILQIMADRQKKISELAGAFPKYHMIKTKVEITPAGNWRNAVKDIFKDQEMNERDGIKILFPDSWVHVRESNTEPVVRIIAEAPEYEHANDLTAKVKKILI